MDTDKGVVKACDREWGRLEGVNEGERGHM